MGDDGSASTLKIEIWGDDGMTLMIPTNCFKMIVHYISS